MLNVAFSGTFAARLAARVKSRLTIPAAVTVRDGGIGADELADVDVLVSLAFTREMGAAAGRLRLLQVPGAGLDRIERSALPAGAWLANAYGHEVGIAEYAIGALLTLTREIGRLDTALRQGRWESQWAVSAPPPPPWPELAGKTMGIVGYGRIGREVARRARAFDMAVWAIRRRPEQSPPDGFARVGGPDDLDELLRRADCLLVTAALNEATRGLIDARRLASMKRSAVLINVARAEIVDEDALYDSLSSRAIAGAALDVWYRYPTEPGPTPPSRRPFHELPNVLMTPHVSGWTEGMMEARARLIAGNIERTARGEPPENAIAAD